MPGEAVPTFDADEQMMWNNLPLSGDERVAGIFAVRVVRKSDNGISGSPFNWSSPATMADVRAGHGP